jgi:hypothetical protein
MYSSLSFEKIDASALPSSELCGKTFPSPPKAFLVPL